MFSQTLSPQPKVHVIHENGEWTAPLFSALEARGIAYADWDMSTATIDMATPAPEGVFYNRMSASSHTRGNRFAPETTAGVLAWLEAQGRRTLNGRSALNLEISKLVQYAALAKVGLPVPHTIAVSAAEDIPAAYQRLPFDDVITKHNRAGKGLGVQLLKSEEAVRDYISGDLYSDSVDGLTLVQQYIQPHDQTITRVEFIGGDCIYAVKVDTSNGFELCPADVCSLEGGICATESSPRYSFDIIADFAASPLGQQLVPKMQMLMANEGLDVAAFEFVTGGDGVSYFYDINTNTNYNSEAEDRASIFAMEALADYLGAELSERYSLGFQQAG